MTFPIAKKIRGRGFNGMTYRSRNLAIAAVFAILAVTVTAIYVSHYKGKVDARAATVNVLVAARDIPIGTPGSALLADGYARIATVPQAELVPSALTSVTEARGHVVGETIHRGEQVTARRFAAAGVEGVQLNLTKTLRAVQLEGNATQLLAGTLEAGDRVDVFASLSYPEGGTRHFAGAIVRNLLVLKAAEDSGSSKLTTGATPTASSVLLAMTDRQAQRMLFAVKNGDWTLALRPVTKPRDSAPTIDSAWTVLTNGGSRADVLQKAAR
jgi:Flp pilus assembly protein CpaB